MGLLAGSGSRAATDFLYGNQRLGKRDVGFMEGLTACIKQAEG